MFRTLVLSLSFLGFFSAYAESHHHEREKVKIEFTEHHHHQKGIGRMLFDGSVQLAENNTYILSATAAVVFLYSPLLKRHLNEAGTFATAAGIWLGGGMITRSFLKAVMSQANIKRI
jgi:hypothetical protein